MSDHTVWSELKENITFQTLQELVEQHRHSFFSYHLPTSSVSDAILLVILAFMHSNTCFLSFSYSHNRSLWLACFQTSFSMLALGVPTVASSACLIWVWKQCANIACLYPLCGIMATITHRISAETDISLSLCWQTTHTSHCSATLFFVLQAIQFLLQPLQFFFLRFLCHFSIYL